MCRYDTQPISFSHAEKYCVKCGRKESYNGNKPFTAPIKCQHCHGRMTDDRTEKFLKQLDDVFNRKGQYKNEILDSNDFTIKTLKTIKSWFVDDIKYPGKIVKSRIDEMLLRMK